MLSDEDREALFGDGGAIGEVQRGDPDNRKSQRRRAAELAQQRAHNDEILSFSQDKEGGRPGVPPMSAPPARPSPLDAIGGKLTAMIATGVAVALTPIIIHWLNSLHS